MSKIGEPGYEIVRATGVCAATGHAIQVGEEFIAALVESEDGSRLERQDFQLAAWQSGARPQPNSRLFGSWRATMPEPNEKRKALIDDESMMDLFEQLEEATESPKISLRYILTLMLMRRKLLKYEGTRRDRPGAPKGLVMLVRRSTKVSEPQAPLMEVIDPGMDDQAIADAIEQLGSVMATGPGGAP